MSRIFDLKTLTVMFLTAIVVMVLYELKPKEDLLVLRLMRLVADEKHSFMYHEKRIREEEFRSIFKNKTPVGKLNRRKTTKSPATTTKAPLPFCHKRGGNLVGSVFIDQTVPKDMGEIEKTFSVANGGTIEKGGWWSPATCKPRTKVAIIIPYRNRFKQLKVFLRHMHEFLPKQEIFYRIFAVEQLHEDPFNRAGLFNIGFVEALKLDEDFDCFVFSDVDLLPEDDRNYYGCRTSPRHMSVAVDKFNYNLPYAEIFGGVGAVRREHFEKVNGFSNSYWGWGGEDDDLYERLTAVKLNITRPSLKIGRYTMIKINHFQSSVPNPDRVSLLSHATQRMDRDGLNSLKYKLEKFEEEPLVTFLRVSLSRSMYED